MQGDNMKWPKIYLFINNCDDIQFAQLTHDRQKKSGDNTIARPIRIRPKSQVSMQKTQRKTALFCPRKKNVLQKQPHQKRRKKEKEGKKTKRKFVVKATILLINQLSQKFNAFDVIRTKRKEKHMYSD